jgi:flagellar biosynthesis GTPase FlhF
MTNNKYTNGKIYKITDTSYNECYIGSTVQTLSQRIAGHRGNHKQFLKDKKVRLVSVYTLFDNYGLENCKIELLELCPCNSLIELRQREGYYIKALECVNKNIAGRTQREYVNENKDKLSELRKQHNIENKDTLSEHRKQHYNENKDTITECRKQYERENKDKISDRRQKYYNENKDTIRQRRKQQYNENKDKITERRKEYRSENKDKLKEQRHQQYMKHKITQLNNSSSKNNAIDNLSHTENQEDNTNRNILNLV